MIAEESEFQSADRNLTQSVAQFARRYRDGADPDVLHPGAQKTYEPAHRRHTSQADEPAVAELRRYVPAANEAFWQPIGLTT